MAGLTSARREIPELNGGEDTTTME